MKTTKIPLPRTANRLAKKVKLFCHIDDDYELPWYEASYYEGSRPEYWGPYHDWSSEVVFQDKKDGTERPVGISEIHLLAILADRFKHRLKIHPDSEALKEALAAVEDATTKFLGYERDLK